jgi:3-hydroxymyristoyl/3-hydroxydecanoyl-(acyl carrier protein) dehydratase
VVYEITIKELGYNPAPYAVADTLIFVDGKPAVEMNNMAIQMTGWNREALGAMWSEKVPGTTASRKPLFDYDSILAFSSGKPSEAFGDRYKIFDEERVIARLPRPPYQFLDRIVDIKAEQWVMKAGGEIVAEYDVPPDEWYFASNRQPYMPFSILLEIALQPCGWLAAYMGSALTSDVDLHFRNLGGSAAQLAQVTPDMGTLSTWVKATSVSSSGGMIIQNYEYEMRCGGTLVYKGDTYFGYFSSQALADQIGIRDAALYALSDGEQSEAVACAYPREAPYPDDSMRMVDTIEVYLPQGGAHGLGFIRGGIDVNPDAWFFQAHFYQDPVWPGSLGLEGFLQLAKYAAMERWAVGAAPVVETLMTGTKHSWVYRGQVIPKDRRVTIEASIKHIDDEQQIMVLDGYLSVDGRDIYQMTDFAVRLVETGA